jgi:hypothetical protein
VAQACCRAVSALITVRLASQLRLTSSLSRAFRVVRQALAKHLPGIQWPDLPVVGLDGEEGAVVFYPVATPSSGQLHHDHVSAMTSLRGQTGTGI